MKLRIDLETRSRVDLKATNVYRYVEDPDFAILMCGWKVDNEPTQLATTPEEILDIPGLWDSNVVKTAHNAQFERICLSQFMKSQHWPDGPALNPFEYLPPSLFEDTQARAAEWGWPTSLGELAVAIGAEEKDSAGTHLINWFCKPDRNGNFRRPEDHPEKWKQFCDYCIQDVDTLADVDDRLEGWPTKAEYLNFLADQVTNDRGIRVDLEMAEAAVDAAITNRMEQELEVSSLAGVINPGSQPQMLGWFRSSGLKITDLKKETIEAQLQRDDLTDTQRRVLELRQELALSAASKYANVIASTNSDGRLRGQLKFYGAHTGRWSGKGVQLHNLPRQSLDSDLEAEMAILDLKMGEGADANTLKALVRPMLLGPFTVADYSAIEARVIAWLAGEEWALEAFRAGRDIYVETAERMPGGPFSRSDGKIATLALGFQGAINSLRAMGAQGTDEELQKIVDAWRSANARIKRFWALMEAAFIKGGPVGDHIRVEIRGADRYVWLPSGRALVYRGFRLETKQTVYGERKTPTFRDYRRGGYRQSTYGGRLTENVVQAVARDLLAHSLAKMVGLGKKPVAHIHDEIIEEFVSTGAHEGHSTTALRNIMVDTPEWAKGLPVDAEGFTCERYKKG